MAEVTSPITGSVWKIEVRVGDVVAVDDIVAVLESMKMEIPVVVEVPGTVAEILVGEGESVAEGDVIMVLREPADS